MISEDLLERHFGGEFRWGVRDCSTAACDAFAELWGVDPLAPHRDRYRTRAEAKALIAEHGGELRLAGATCRAAGLVHRWPEETRAGDLALLHLHDRKVLGLAIGDGWFAAKAPGGRAAVRSAIGCWGLP